MSQSNSQIMISSPISDNKIKLPMSHNVPVKPITLTIAPVDNGTVLPQTPTQLTATHTLLPAPINGTAIPNFNHVPIAPILLPKQSKISDIDLQEKEARRLEGQRQRNHRYYEKAKNYTKLGTLPNEKDKVVALLRLCYPFLESIQYNDQNELDRMVSEFLVSVISRFGVTSY